MIYKPFSRVVVPFPFTDSKKEKRRPALVLSTEKFQSLTGHVTLLMVTSAVHSDWHGDHNIKDLDVTGLRAASCVRQKIFTLDLRLILKAVGRLSLQDKRAVQKVLHQNLSV